MKNYSAFISYFQILSKAKKKYLLLIIFLSVISAFFELASVLVVIPVVSILFISPDLVSGQKNLYSQIISDFIAGNILSNQYGALLIFMLGILIAGTLRLIVMYANIKYAFSIGIDLSIKVYSQILKAPYQVSNQLKSSKAINMANEKINIIIHNVFLPFLSLLTSIIVVTIIFGFIFVTNPLFVIFAIFFMLSVYFLYDNFTKTFIRSGSLISDVNLNNATRSMQNGLGSLKDITLTGTHNYFISDFKKFVKLVRLSQFRIAFIKFSPRILIETLILLLVCFFALINNINSLGSIVALPIIAMYFFAFIKIAPYFNTIHQSIISIRGDYSIFQSVIKFLSSFNSLPAPKSKLQLKRYISLKNVSFLYSKNKLILNDINLKIKKGSMVGITGKSGSGKTTLVNLLTGLLMPSKGFFYVDNIKINIKNVSSWYENISYLSQDFYLVDSTIAANVAFGMDEKEIIMSQVSYAIEQSGLLDFVESLPYKYYTRIGEKGIGLSGGQKQRLAFARALYRKSSILILDEPSSSLDKDSEAFILESIKNIHKDLTVFIISHNPSFLKYCDLLIEVNNKKVLIK